MMKYTFTAILALVMLLSFCSIGQAQEAPSKAGKVAVLFTLEGLSNIGTTPYNGGIGGKFYLTNKMALRGSFGGTYTSAPGESWPVTTVTAALLNDVMGTENTNAYLGVEGHFNHFQPETNTYGLAGVVGGEFFPWKNVSLSSEYKVVFDHNTQDNITTVSLGKNLANFTLAIYFN